MVERKERRSPESLLARELVVVKDQAASYESDLRDLGPLQLRRRAVKRRQLEMALERERQILSTLGAKRRS
jgi:hypothetical protein